MPVAGFEPKAVHGVVAGVLQPMGPAGFEDGVVEGAGVLPRYVQLPAQLADVGQPERPHVVSGDLDALGGPERKAVVAEVGRRQL